MTILLTVLLGLFGGIGGTLLWEGLIGPWKTNRNVARAIMAETSFNLQIMAYHLSLGYIKPKSIPGDFSLCTLAFNALADKVGFLPSRILREIIVLYSNIDSLNFAARQFHETLNLWRTTLESTAKSQIQAELDSILRTFYTSLDTVIDKAENCQSILYPLAESLKIRKEPMDVLSMAAVDDNVRQYLATRKSRTV